MLQVVKVGGSVSGRYFPRHMEASTSSGTFGGEFVSPSCIRRSATLRRQSSVNSSFTNSCADMWVVARSMI